MPSKDQKYATCTYENGQSNAKLPWKEEVYNLPSNEIIAMKRTQNNIICRLSRDPGMRKTYDNTIEEQEKCGFIEKVEQVHYIPHHTGKKRIKYTTNLDSL